jgi:hypothetical protein
MPNTSTSKKHFNQQLEAKMDVIGFAILEPEITDLRFKSMGKLTPKAPKQSTCFVDDFNKLELD